MELLNQHAKKIMERCKARAKERGLIFNDNTLEFITSNRDLIQISPKVMIPTMYDYWIHDLEAYRDQKKYELYPNNPYETVINTRPAISFYNDDNPDWLNCMIFYHVLGHIDFFQNNQFFRQTWGYDFLSKALSGKRIIERLRSEHGRWVDYVIEFSRGIDNLVNFHKELDRSEVGDDKDTEKIKFFFNVFIQTPQKNPENNESSLTVYGRWLKKQQVLEKENPKLVKNNFLLAIKKSFSEFEDSYRKWKKKQKKESVDLLEFVMNNSEKLQKEENKWMLEVMQIVRETSLFFQPQIRTKTMNEGWASYWHEKLFLNDRYIHGHEVDFAKVQSQIISLSRLGHNPYAVGLRLFQYIEEMADKGKMSLEFNRISDKAERCFYDKKTDKGQETIFQVRETHADSTFIPAFISQEFVDRHKLFVVGMRINPKKLVREYYVKSRKVEDYRDMLLSSLYHPPSVKFFRRKRDGALLIYHKLEDKPLVRDYIDNVLVGLEFLWGRSVALTTYEPEIDPEIIEVDSFGQAQKSESTGFVWRKMQYVIQNGKIKTNKKGISGRRKA